MSSHGDRGLASWEHGPAKSTRGGSGGTRRHRRHRSRVWAEGPHPGPQGRRDPRADPGPQQRWPGGRPARSCGRGDTALSWEGGRGRRGEGRRGAQAMPPGAVGCGVRDTRRPAAPPAGPRLSHSGPRGAGARLRPRGHSRVGHGDSAAAAAFPPPQSPAPANRRAAAEDRGR